MTSLKVSSEDLAVAQAHFRAFADEFLSADCASRWCELFIAASAAKWRKLDPWVVWDETKRRADRRFDELQGRVRELALDRQLCPDPEQQVVVIAFGHSKPNVLVKSLSGLAEAEWPVDGLVSYRAGATVFVKNHDGEVMVCRR